MHLLAVEWGQTAVTFAAVLVGAAAAVIGSMLVARREVTKRLRADLHLRVIPRIQALYGPTIAHLEGNPRWTTDEWAEFQALLREATTITQLLSREEQELAETVGFASNLGVERTAMFERPPTEVTVEQLIMLMNATQALSDVVTMRWRHPIASSLTHIRRRGRGEEVREEIRETAGPFSDDDLP
jgi:hypothetical protein